MQLPTWNNIRTLFKALCLVTTIYMLIFWCYKFVIEDEDLCLVDYTTVEQTEDNELPVVSMCIKNPFLDINLLQINPNINSSLYLRYLKGEIVDQRLADIDYSNVTIDLSNYAFKSYTRFRNGTRKWNASNIHNIHVTFNGFFVNSFYKCFGLKIEDQYYRDVKVVNYRLKQHELLDGSRRSSHKLGLFIHYPNQFLLSKEPAWFSVNKPSNISNRHTITIRGAEILVRRNKAKRKCMLDGKYYDDLLLKKHIEDQTCRAPYHMEYKQVPICNTKEKIRASIYDMSNLKDNNILTPCRSLTKTDAQPREIDREYLGYAYRLMVKYPDQLKIIKQSKSVDMHSFIGNIGGYIGLFLGKVYYRSIILQLCVYIFKIITKCIIFNHSNHALFALQDTQLCSCRIYSYFCISVLGKSNGFVMYKDQM